MPTKTKRKKRGSSGIMTLKGRYMTLPNYAKKEGITYVGAFKRVERGNIKAIKIGPMATLVKIA